VISEVFARQFVLELDHWNWTVNKQGYAGVMPSVFCADELGTLRMPILMLVGEHDKLKPPKAVQRAQQMILHIESQTPVTCFRWSSSNPWIPAS
jgi:hypothetical protein